MLTTTKPMKSVITDAFACLKAFVETTQAAAFFGMPSRASTTLPEWLVLSTLACITMALFFHKSSPLPNRPSPDHLRDIHQTSHLAPHQVLQRYIHPSTSLWPPTYLRAFAAAQASKDGVIHLSLKELVKDVKRGRIVLRYGEAVRIDALRWAD